MVDTEKRTELVIDDFRKWANSEKMMELPSEIINEAIELFKTLQKDKFNLGILTMINAYACLFYIIKTDPSCPAISPRQFIEALPEDVERYYIRNPKLIFKAYRKIVRKYGISPQTCTLRPLIFVKKFGPMLGFDKDILQKATDLAEEMVREKAHQGRSPIVSAAACLAVIDFQIGKKRNRKEIAEICGVSDTAIKGVLHIPFFAKKEREGRIQRKKYLKSA